MNILEKIKEIKKYINILIISYKKKETPWYAKVVVALTIGYALSPIDLIPDFIPVLGYLDDAIILPLLILLSIKLVPKRVLEQAREEFEAKGLEKQPKKWYYGLPIILFWIVLIVILYFYFLK